MKTFFDANVILEVALKSRRKSHIASTVLSRAEKAYISPLSAHLYIHFCKKEGHKIKDLLDDLSGFGITIMDENTLSWARVNRQNEDFEDALQIASAVLSGCEQFVTFDKKLAQDYKNLPTLKIKLLK